VYVAGGNGVLAAIDTKTGKVVASAEIAKNVDQSAFDARHHRVYCAGQEQLTVVEVSDSAQDAGQRRNEQDRAECGRRRNEPARCGTTYTDGKNSYAQSWKRP